MRVRSHRRGCAMGQSNGARWLAWLRVERGLLDSTITGYKRELLNLHRAKGDPTSLTVAELRSYIVEAGGGPSTVAGRIAAMRSFYGFLVRSGIRIDDPTVTLDRPKQRRGLPKPIQDREKLLAQLDPDYRLIATFLLETGLRISEAVAVRLPVPAPAQMVVRGKGAKERLVLLTDEARAAIDALGGTVKYQVRTIQRNFKAAGFNPHARRHTLACDLAASGADLGEVQEILGHANPATTKVYMAYGIDRIQRAHERRKAHVV